MLIFLSRPFVLVSIVVFVAALQPVVGDIVQLNHYATCDNCKHCKQVLSKLSTNDGNHVHCFGDIMAFIDRNSSDKLVAEYERWNQDHFLL